MEVPAAQEIAGRSLPSTTHLVEIRDQVVDCRRCPRLVEYRERIAREKRREFSGWNYWGRPVPGFGDPNATLLIVGLAPAAHGGNRTGRVFTGDRSGDFLYRALYKSGFANQPTSDSIDDGLEMVGAYITAAVKCAPPDNKPSSEEMMNCSSYLSVEMDALPRLKSVLCLGQFAFTAVLRTLRNKHPTIDKRVSFAHGRVIKLEEEIPVVICSYHPSPRNTQTGRLSEKMFLAVLNKVRALQDAKPKTSSKREVPRQNRTRGKSNLAY